MIPKRTPKRVTGSSPRQNRRPGLARISRSSRSSAFSFPSRAGSHRPVNLGAPGLRSASSSLTPRANRQGHRAIPTRQRGRSEADTTRPPHDGAPRDTSMDDPSGDLLSLVSHQDQVSTKPGQLHPSTTGPRRPGHRRCAFRGRGHVSWPDGWLHRQRLPHPHGAPERRAERRRRLGRAVAQPGRRLVWITIRLTPGVHAETVEIQVSRAAGCPVCRCPGLTEEAWDDGRPSHEICPSRGTEFGYDHAVCFTDPAALPQVYDKLRQAWVGGGMVMVAVAPPTGRLEAERSPVGRGPSQHELGWGHHSYAQTSTAISVGTSISTATGV